MLNRILFRWMTFCAVCTIVVLMALIVFFMSTEEITDSKLITSQATSRRSNLKNHSEICETKSKPPVIKTKPMNDTRPVCPSFDKQGSSLNKTMRKGCSVPVFTSRNPKDYYSRNSSCPLCTSALFKNYYRTHSAFISRGYWDVLLAEEDEIRSATFRPPFCSFRRRDLGPDFIKKCFVRRRVLKIVTLGDSNGRMTFFGLKAILAASGIKQCELVKAEEDSYFTNISYYIPAGTRIPLGSVSIGKRGCHSCNGRQFLCFHENRDSTGISYYSTSLVLEHLPLSRILDGSVRILRPVAGFRPTNYTQEFLFRDYLGQSGQPDVVIIVTPFLHEVQAKLQGHGTRGLKGAIGKLVSILNKYLPKSTHVYWIPSQYVFGGGELADVRRCNRDLYDVLKADVGAVGNRMHRTFDLMSLSCPLVGLSISDDPYHMQPKWYDVIAKHLLELHCND